MPKTLIEVETLRRLRGQSAEYREGYEAGLAEAAQTCRYMLKHQNFPAEDSDDYTDYHDGFTIACELCDEAIRALEPEEPGG